MFQLNFQMAEDISMRVDQHLLPAPANLFMVSINLKHFLYWDPVTVAGNITYSVQSQGEFETIYLKDTWHEAENCQEISTKQCNVTDEVSAGVLYRFKVRAILGDQRSDWAELEPPFDRKTTILTPPKVDLQVSGLNLVVHTEDYGPSFQFFVFYWQKGKKEDKKAIKPSSFSTSTFLEEAEQGKEYCAEVIAYASTIFRNSSSSEPVCVQVKQLQPSGLFTGLLCVFGIVLAFLPMVLVGRKVKNVMLYVCCPDEEIPAVLTEPCINVRMRKSHDTNKESTEELYSVDPDEHLFS
ncbi:interleukin-20 receptor subunit beta [Hyla sarda]|uniref:interleukin-20 receptor subunit beta n=1 Tax=Hyla sarda TaxID=327740 RepID=UPI0024C2F431|nr:interleukin-20 receptor subunit beta [Hyla sarda]